MPWNPVTGRYEGESAVTSQLPPEVVEAERRRRMTPADEAVESLAREEGRLLAASRLLGSAGGGTSSKALGAVIPTAALKQMVGEIVRSIPRHLRQSLRPSRRRINVMEQPAAEMNRWFDPMPGTFGRVGGYTRVHGIPGEGTLDYATGKSLPKSLEEIEVLDQLPEDFKRQTLTHEIAEHARRGWKRLLPMAEGSLSALADKIPGFRRSLTKRGYDPLDIQYEGPAHLVELTQKPRYYQTGGEEAARQFYVEERRRLNKLAEMEAKNKGIAKALGLTREKGRAVYMD